MSAPIVDLPPQPKDKHTIVTLYANMPDPLDRMRVNVKTGGSVSRTHVHFGPLFSGFGLCLSDDEVALLGNTLLEHAAYQRESAAALKVRKDALEADRWACPTLPPFAASPPTGASPRRRPPTIPPRILAVT